MAFFQSSYSEAFCSIIHTKQGKRSLFCLFCIFSSLNVNFPTCSVFAGVLFVVFFCFLFFSPFIHEYQGHHVPEASLSWEGRRSFQLKWRFEFQWLYRAGHCNCYMTVSGTKNPLIFFCFCPNLRGIEKLWHLPKFLSKDHGKMRSQKGFKGIKEGKNQVVLSLHPTEISLFQYKGDR